MSLAIPANNGLGGNSFDSFEIPSPDFVRLGDVSRVVYRICWVTEDKCFSSVGSHYSRDKEILKLTVCKRNGSVNGEIKIDVCFFMS